MMRVLLKADNWSVLMRQWTLVWWSLLISLRPNELLPLIALRALAGVRTKAGAGSQVLVCLRCPDLGEQLSSSQVFQLLRKYAKSIPNMILICWIECFPWPHFPYVQAFKWPDLHLPAFLPVTVSNGLYWGRKADVLVSVIPPRRCLNAPTYVRHHQGSRLAGDQICDSDQVH